jgi:AraC family transcriptional regulator
VNPVAKALWFIASHLADDVTPTGIADIAGVSRFHMVRAFGMTTGHAVMRDVRGRRLSQAARALANGASDILAVALAAGYASHEAFIRAFRDRFGSTPDMVRTTALSTTFHLWSQSEWMKQPTSRCSHPGWRQALHCWSPAFERCSFDTTAVLPALWQRFRPHIGHIPDQVSPIAYGICYNIDDTSLDDIAGVEVRGFASLATEFARLRIGEQHYTVFTHIGHISTACGTFMAIFNDWFLKSGHSPADAPVFERYYERFDPRTGNGGFEIWGPVRT